MSEWVELKIGDVCEINKKSIHKNFPFNEILYLDTGSITNGRIEMLQTLKLVNAPSRAKRIVNNGDIIYSTVRPNQNHFGYLKKVDENLIVSTGFVVISPKNEICGKYLYHYITQQWVTDQLHSIAEGSTSTYPSLKPEDIANFKVFFPPLPEQQAIAEVLSSLDEKIDLLHSNNKTLEEMAETLFRQWFVDGAKEEWEIKRLDDICFHIKKSINPQKSEISSFYHYSLPAFDNGKRPELTDSVSILSNKYLIESEDILISKLNPRTPRVWIIGNTPVNSICSTEFQVYRAKEAAYKYFSYCFLRTQQVTDTLAGASSGTSGSHQRVSPEDISSLEFPIPPNDVLIKFHETCEPIFKKIELNLLSILSLDESRNTLLPKLMSGQVRVNI